MNIGFVLLLLTILAIGALIYTMSRIRAEGFTDNSGAVVDPSGAVVDPSGGVLTKPLPTNKRELLAHVLDILRAEITRLNGLNRTDIVLITRVQNLTRLRDALQRIYVDLMEGRIRESDIDFGPEEVAAFLPSIGPKADLNRELPNLLNVELDTLSTTFSALRDANIYWSLELGVQNYNPQPTSIIARPGIDSYSGGRRENDYDSTRGRNAQTIDGRWSVPSRDEPLGTDRSWSKFTQGQAEVDPLDYKQRIKSTCDAIKRGQLGDPVRDFGCFEKGAEVGPTFDYKGRYYLICERLGLTWGAGYQQMLGCPIQFTN